MNRRSLLTLLGSSLVGITGCLGDEPPSAEEPDPPDALDADWPMPAADHGRTHYTPASSGPDEPVAELWSVETGAEPTTPIVVDSIVFIGTADGELFALDARDGTELWTAAVDGVVDAVRYAAGRIHVETDERVVALDDNGEQVWIAEPMDLRRVAVSEHGVYLLDRRGESTHVVALDPTEGAKGWRTDLERLFELDDDGTILADSVPGGHPGGLAVRDGHLVHGDLEGNVHGPDWIARPNAHGFGRFTIAPDRVYVHANDGEKPGLYAYALIDGSRAWHADVNARGPVVATDDALFVPTAGRDRGLTRLDPDDGNEQWSRSAPDVGERFALVDDLLYTTSDGLVRAFRAP
ncbi:WD40/PQQ-like beta propeller repeat containing protein [Halalkaliarchaeum desulfuricum]|uniref:WD40/PQQ-like beta propeller repeat containing protein n=1 Tax=Halalkaliarchaeum desulfuricum TaxID=2055893 RepID=A0A343TG85_9EURY|nr:PQQ-binding-like beta-propeller repeat protein [Halalkaliarchaeum desulfuricum]AUX08107.1 WD40/PQQ-like beta propeller repeat containing protein [Halalkaliarchaeum desulfuricum]